MISKAQFRLPMNPAADAQNVHVVVLRRLAVLPEVSCRAKSRARMPVILFAAT